MNNIENESEHLKLLIVLLNVILKRLSTSLNLAYYFTIFFDRCLLHSKLFLVLIEVLV